MEGREWQDNSSGRKEHFFFLPPSPADSLTLHRCLMNAYGMNRQTSGGRVWPQDIGALLRAASSGPCATSPGLSVLWSSTEFTPRVCITGSSAGEQSGQIDHVRKSNSWSGVVAFQLHLECSWEPKTLMHCPHTQGFRSK